MSKLLLVLLLLEAVVGLDFRSQVYHGVNQQPQLIFTGSNNPYEQLAQPVQNNFQPSSQNHQQQQSSQSQPIQGHIIGGDGDQLPVASFPIADFFQPNLTGMLPYSQQQTTWSTPPPLPYQQNQQNYNHHNAISYIPQQFTQRQYTTTAYYTQPSTTPPPPPPSTTVYTTTFGPTATPLLWTTKATKTPAKMSKLSVKPLKKAENSTGAAQVSVPSHRLLNDILVIPSSRRLYILAIFPIHESADYRGFECGRVDVNGFIRMAAFLDALNAVNSQKVLKDAGLSLGAVIVDSCSSDLRTVADLYELLSGTNIQKTDLVAMVRDDGAHLPNVDEFARHLKIPTINTFFSPMERPLTTGTLPSMQSPLEAMLGLLHYTNSKCVNLLYDDRHASTSLQLMEMAAARGVCVEHSVALANEGKSAAESAVRRLLLTEARIVIVLLGEGNWVELMKALREEMVIAGRFIVLTPQDPRWFTSKQFIESWPHFDQLLLSVATEKVRQNHEQQVLTSQFAKLPFPLHWRSQFWSTAFKCHVGGEREAGEQFSKECEEKQLLNLTNVAPDLDIAPVTVAVHSVAHAVRKLVDNVCPGALVQSLNDCLNDPQDTLFNAILNLRFVHALGDSGEVYFNGTSGFRDSRLIVNRVWYNSQLEVDKIAEWDTLAGFKYTAPMELIMEERDGSRVPLRSTCPRSTCSAEEARRLQAGSRPAFRDSLKNLPVLCFAIVGVIVFFVCLMCMYHRLISDAVDEYRTCTVMTLGGVSSLCLVSIFFIMPPNPVSCAVRRLSLAPALSATMAPVLVKTMFVWRSELRDVTAAPKRTSPLLLFWISFAVILLQTVISLEWAFFEWPTDITFITSHQHGMAWRCAPGENFEHRLLHSCALCGAFIILILVCSILSIRKVESRQNILITVIAGFIALGLYLSLPLLSFALRDQVIGGVLLGFVFVVILITYTRGAFEKGDHQDSSRGSLMTKSTMDRSEKMQNPFWLESHVLSPRGNTLSLQRNYHQATTLPQQMNTVDRYLTAGYGVPPSRNGYGGSQTQLNRVSLNLDVNGAPRVHAIQRPPMTSSQRYGVEGYELPPSPLPPINTNLSKYGSNEFVLEEESAHIRL